MNIFFAIAASYFLGAIPTAFLAGKWLKGIDIRQHGSGNVGATNAFRVLGKGAGCGVFLFDVFKGVLAVVFIGDILEVGRIVDRIFLGIAAVCGHNWTIFLQFKGGKGIATSLGVLIGLAIKFAVIRPVLLYSVLMWACVFFGFGYVSLASLAAAIALPIIMVLTGQTLEVTLLGVVFCLFVLFRHRPNLKRLFAGKESRVPLPYLRVPKK